MLLTLKMSTIFYNYDLMTENIEYFEYYMSVHRAIYFTSLLLYLRKKKKKLFKTYI